MTRTVLVTGAGAGLGRALVRAALDRGDRAVAVGRDRGALEETVRGHDAAALIGVADVTDLGALLAIVAEAEARFGAVDALVGNAAVYPRGRLDRDDPRDALPVFATNVIGVANAIRAVLPGMMRRASGRIVTVGSFADRDPLPDSWAYSASKGALHSLTKAAANEVAGDYPDILVNEWVPGSLNTQMGVPQGLDPAVAARWGLKWIDLPPGGPSGQLFSGDTMVQPPLGLKRRILRKVGLG